MLVADASSACRSRPPREHRKADLAIGGAFFGGGAGVGAGGYGRTNEGKIIAEAFRDNYNEVVRAVRNDPSLIRNVGTLKGRSAAGGSTKAGAATAKGTCC